MNNFNYSKIKFWKTGYPNYDDQINNKYDITKIRKYLKINNNNKNILYSPSYEEGSSLREGFELIIQEFSKMKKFNFIIKLHPVVFTNYRNKFYTGGINWYDKLCKIEKKYKNIFFYKKIKINPLFKLCDVMITDYSGVGVGFMLEKKPVIYLTSKNYFSCKLKKLGFDVNLSNNKYLNNYMYLGKRINNIKNLQKYLIIILKQKLFYKKKLRNFANKILYYPGFGSKNTYNAINKILNVA